MLATKKTARQYNLQSFVLRQFVMAHTMNSTFNSTSRHVEQLSHPANNLTCYTILAWRIILTNKQSTTIAVCCAVNILPVVLLNSALCFALYTTGKVAKASKFLIFILSLSDCATGLVTIPASVVLTTTLSHQRCCWLEMFTMFFGQSTGHFSFYIIMAIAVQRYLKVTPSLKFIGTFQQSILSLTGLKVATLVILLWSLFHGLVSTYFFGNVTSKVLNAAMVIVRLLIFVIVCVCYFRMYWSIRQHMNEEPQQQGTSLQTHSQENYKKFVKTVSITLIVLAVTYLPLMATDMWTRYYTLIKKIAAPQLPRFLYYLSFTMFFSNGAFNAIIFLRADKDLLAKLTIACKK